jgi:hypothetical protein
MLPLQQCTLPCSQLLMQHPEHNHVVWHVLVRTCMQPSSPPLHTCATRLPALLQYLCMFLSAGEPGQLKKVQASVTAARKVFRIMRVSGAPAAPPAAASALLAQHTRGQLKQRGCLQSPPPWSKAHNNPATGPILPPTFPSPWCCLGVHGGSHVVCGGSSLSSHDAVPHAQPAVLHTTVAGLSTRRQQVTGG